VVVATPHGLNKSFRAASRSPFCFSEHSITVSAKYIITKIFARSYLRALLRNTQILSQDYRPFVIARAEHDGRAAALWLTGLE